MKKDYCRKCNTYTYVEKHHILPKSSFGETSDIAELCSNCHTEYHQKLGCKNLENNDMDFHLRFWFNWFYSGALLIIILLSIIGITILSSIK